MEKLLYLVPVCGLVALLFALFTARYIGKKDAGTALPMPSPPARAPFCLPSIEF